LRRRRFSATRIGRGQTGRRCAAATPVLTESAAAPAIVAPLVLLGNHLKALKLPTFVREYEKVAMESAQDRADYPRYVQPVAARPSSYLSENRYYRPLVIADGHGGPEAQAEEDISALAEQMIASFRELGASGQFIGHGIYSWTSLRQPIPPELWSNLRFDFEANKASNDEFSYSHVTVDQDDPAGSQGVASRRPR
jgi:hypothetical protein